MSARVVAAFATVTAAFGLAACGASGSAENMNGSDAGKITVYTCVSDTTIQPVIEAFEAAHEGTSVELYRAPTGDLNARIAGDVRAGGLEVDVVWACDPLTMADYTDQGLVGGWVPETEVAEQLRTDDYVGAHVLYMLAVTREGVEPPRSWSDLAGGRYGAVAVPDPSFAASALGTLGYFADQPDYGIGFYADLEQNGGVQVSTPNDVVSGVAEGVYDAGVTIANAAYAAHDDGAPIQVTWPEPGAVAVYGPVALAREAAENDAAKDFITFVTSREGQSVVGESGSYPTLEGVAGPTVPDGASVVHPDWTSLAAQKDDLLTEYQRIFGG
jgi:iron(III) transport system substrate-binding protein